MDDKFIEYAKRIVDEHPKLSRTGFSKKIGRTQGYVSQLFSGKIVDTAKYASELQDYLKSVEAIKPMVVIDQLRFDGANCFSNPSIIDQWYVPASIFNIDPGQLQDKEDNIFVLSVPDNANAPILMKSDFVFIDKTATMPVTGAFFLVKHSQNELSLRKCETIPQTNTVRLKPMNDKFETHDVELTDDLLVGRVIGQFRSPSDF